MLQTKTRSNVITLHLSLLSMLVYCQKMVKDVSLSFNLMRDAFLRFFHFLYLTAGIHFISVLAFINDTDLFIYGIKPENSILKETHYTLSVVSFIV